MSIPAIFLSYAREDAPSARRIAEALRAAGIEVWFDENELRGGDAWDAKIRRQIRECTLFLSVISGQTQAAVDGLARFFSKPNSFGVNLMRTDPTLRHFLGGYAPYEALLADPKNKAAQF